MCGAANGHDEEGGVTPANLRRWLAEWPHAIRVDYFPESKPGYRWAVVGIKRGGRVIVSTVSGRSLRDALERFARQLDRRKEAKRGQAR